MPLHPFPAREPDSLYDGSMFRTAAVEEGPLIIRPKKPLTERERNRIVAKQLLRMAMRGARKAAEYRIRKRQLAEKHRLIRIK